MLPSLETEVFSNMATSAGQAHACKQTPRGWGVAHFASNTFITYSLLCSANVLLTPRLCFYPCASIVAIDKPALNSL